MTKPPTIGIFDHQTRQPASVELWQTTALRALPLCLAAARSPHTDLHRLDEIEISLVSDEDIARVHGEFLDDPTPTDVITFPHGEILISLDTAQRQCAEHAQTYENEVTLYIIHALLHLAGWNDHDPLERDEMHRKQEGILAALNI